MDTLYYNDIGLSIKDRLITFSPPDSESQENPGVYIFPDIGKEYLEIYTGLGIIEDWTGTSIFAPIIISTKPISNSIQEGRITNNKVLIETLEEKIFKYLPRTI